MNIQTKQKITAAIDKAVLFFFMALVFLLPIAKAGIESIFGLIFFSFLVKFAIVRPPLKKIKTFFSDRINLSLLIFYIAIGLSMFVSGEFLRSSFNAWFFKWGEGVIFFYLGRVFLNKRHVKMLLYIFLLGCCLISINGLYQWVNSQGFIRGFSLVQSYDFYAVRSTFNHYNNFATYLVVLFFIACGFLFSTKKYWFKAPLVLLLCLIVINLFLTHSRGAWLGLLAGLVIFILFLPNKKMRKILVYSFFISLVLILCFPAGAKLVYGFFIRGGEARFGIWQAAIEIFLKSPIIGTGLGLFMKILPLYGFEVLYAHNCYLQILAETGVVGLSTFLVFCAGLIVRACRKILNQFDVLSLGLLCGLLGYLIHSFFDTQLYSLKIATLFWLFASLVCVYTGKDENSVDGVNTND